MRVFVPDGLDVPTLDHYFRLAYRTFYGRPDVLWGLARTLAGEPRFLARMGTYVRVGMRDWPWPRPVQADGPAALG